MWLFFKNGAESCKSGENGLTFPVYHVTINSDRNKRWSLSSEPSGCDLSRLVLYMAAVMPFIYQTID